MPGDVQRIFTLRQVLDHKPQDGFCLHRLLLEDECVRVARGSNWMHGAAPRPQGWLSPCDRFAGVYRVWSEGSVAWFTSSWGTRVVRDHVASHSFPPSGKPIQQRAFSKRFPGRWGAAQIFKTDDFRTEFLRIRSEGILSRQRLLG